MRLLLNSHGESLLRATGASSANQQEEDEARRRAFLMYFYQKQQTFYLTCLHRDFLSQEAMRRRDRRLRRATLLHPSQSPWKKLYDSKDDAAFITVTGYDVNAFHVLLAKFKPFCERYTPWTGSRDGSTYATVKRTTRRGRPRMVDAVSCLGIVLAWYRFKGAEFIMQGWFGFTGNHTSVWIRFGRRMLLKALWKDEQAKVAYPTDTKIEDAPIDALYDVLEYSYSTVQYC